MKCVSEMLCVSVLVVVFLGVMGFLLSMFKWNGNVDKVDELVWEWMVLNVMMK